MASDASSSAPAHETAPFVNKLFEIITQAVGDDEPIKWGPEGDTIVVTDQVRFARDVLPRYFRHDNIRSFLRQLNIYGFQRCRQPGGSAAVDPAADRSGELEFYHEKFMPGRKDLMRQIARGVPSAKRRVHAPGAGAGADEPASSKASAEALSGELVAVRQQIATLDEHLKGQALDLQGHLTTLINTIGLDFAAVMPPPAHHHDGFGAGMPLAMPHAAMVPQPLAAQQQQQAMASHHVQQHAAAAAAAAVAQWQQQH